MGTIPENIINKREEIISRGIEPGSIGHDIAEDLGKQATAAILNGKDSVEWRNYMRNFASNKAQLLRLLGRDEDYNSNDWSERSLAYITSNPICTTTTITIGRIVETVEVPNVGTLNNMRPSMIEDLANNIDNAPGFDGWFDDFVAEEEAPVVQ